MWDLPFCFQEKVMGLKEYKNIPTNQTLTKTLA